MLPHFALSSYEGRRKRRRRAKEGWGLYEAIKSPSKTKDFSKENLLK